MESLLHADNGAGELTGSVGRLLVGQIKTIKTMKESLTLQRSKESLCALCRNWTGQKEVMAQLANVKGPELDTGATIEQPLHAEMDAQICHI